MIIIRQGNTPPAYLPDFPNPLLQNAHVYLPASLADAIQDSLKKAQN